MSRFSLLSETNTSNVVVVVDLFLQTYISSVPSVLFSTENGPAYIQDFKDLLTHC